MADEPKGPGQGERHKRRRRRRHRHGHGEAPQPPPEAQPPASSSPQPPQDQHMTPWQVERQREEHERQVRESAKPRVVEKDPGPREICTDRPVFLALERDVENEFEEDLVEPEWSIDGSWSRVAEILIPVTRARVTADAGDLFFREGEEVVLSTGRGIELGIALEPPTWREPHEDVKNRILRRYGYSDSRQMTRNETKSVEALDLCHKLIEERRIEMKLLRVEHLHGGGKAVFYFTSEKRVDFRQLIRDLAGQLHTRIEMRQIGVRDASRILGGVGPCGQQVCCNRFLSRFTPVSIKMAKVQSLMLNPAKVSGVCGRLLCCLEYEYEQYRQLLREAPRPGSEVEWPEGRGRVRDLMILEGKCSVELPDGTTTQCLLSRIRSTGPAPQEPDEGVEEGEEATDEE